jgi:hypothetical protein
VGQFGDGELLVVGEAVIGGQGGHHLPGEQGL